MTRKSMVLGLTAVLVVAVAIPVVAQERVVTPKLQKISKRALKKSGTALKTSRAAKRQSRRAEETAQDAVGAASAGAGAAAEINSARIRSAVAENEAGTSFTEGFVALAGGPLIEVTVPPSGLIEVWAQATIDGEGAVSLYEDGRPMPGQAEICSPEPGQEVLFGIESNSEPLTVGTPATAGFGVCGNLGPPGPVLFQTSPGVHVYELRYAACGCGDSPVFSDRRLFVGPRL
ncbi:MAG TPA: hypothetical protein VF030_08660 [Solirubrobacterales bacterium]